MAKGKFRGGMPAGNMNNLLKQAQKCSSKHNKLNKSWSKVNLLCPAAAVW